MSLPPLGPTNPLPEASWAPASPRQALPGDHCPLPSGGSSLISASPPEPLVDHRHPMQILWDFITCGIHFAASLLEKTLVSLCSCFQKPSEPVSVAIGSPDLSSDLPVEQEQRGDSPVAVGREQQAPPPRQVSAFDSLPISDDDRAHIRFIVHNLATATIMPAQEMYRRGSLIHDLHAFRFLEFILKDSEVTKDFASIRTRMFGTLIWNQFLNEQAEKFEEQHKLGKLLPHVDAFAKSIGRNPNVVRDYVTRKDWHALANYLVDTITAPNTRPSEPVGESPQGPLPPSSVSSEIGPPSHTPVDTVAGPYIPRLNLTDLPFTSENRNKLLRIFRDVGTKNHIALGFISGGLKSDWFALRGVHPLRLLYEVFAGPDAQILKDHLRKIMADSWKKPYFLNDFAETLEQAATTAERIPFIEPFLQEMKADLRVFTDDITLGGLPRWKCMIEYLSLHLEDTRL